MEQIITKIINYLYMLGAVAFVFEYVISEKKGEALALKLIDWSHVLSTENVDKLISKVCLYLSAKYDTIYGEKYFGQREWVAASIIAFTYCYVFYLAENYLGFDSSLGKQLAYWFIPNLIADIISINFTRWLLKKLSKYPEKYFQYLIYDLLVFIICFYICFSFTMIYLSIFSDYSSTRILLHPFYLFYSAVQNYPDTMAIDALFVICIASTTFIPTLLHILSITFALLSKFLIPFLRVFTYKLIEKMISFERHPIGVAIVICGLFVVPFIVLYELIMNL